MKIIRLLGFITAFLLLIPVGTLCAQNTVKVKGVQGRWQVSDEITLKQAEERAFMEAKKAALQKAGVMESVWSVFGQITQNDGAEFHEAYSQMSVLAIGGMVNVTNKKVEELWDVDSRSLYKVVTIDATVQKDDKPDRSYALEVKGVETLYKEGDVFTCRLTVHGTDSYLKFFWFDSTGEALLYPNAYEPNNLLKAGHEYKVPFSNAVDYLMEKHSGKGNEKINIMMVATKSNVPFTEAVTYQSVLKWVYSMPANQRCAFYEMVLIK